MIKTKSTISFIKWTNLTISDNLNTTKIHGYVHACVDTSVYV